MHTQSGRSRSLTGSIALFVFAATMLNACGIGMDAQDLIERGQQAFDDGDYRAAGIDARNVLQKDPENISARLLLGQTAVAVEDGAAAEKELRRAMSLGAAPAQVVTHLARSLLLQRKFADVVEEIDVETAASESDRLELMRSRAVALVGLGQPAEARDVYMDVLAIAPADIDALLGVVRTYMAENSFAQARETMNQILAEHDRNSSAWSTSGTLYYSTRNFEPANRDYKKALELAVQQSDRAAELVAWTGLAEVRLDSDDSDGAREAVGRLLELAPDGLATAFFDARLAYMDQDYSRAQQRLQQVLQIVPENMPAQMLLGAVHLHSGNLSQAEMYLSAVVAAAPTNTASRKLLAETRFQMDKFDEAKAALGPVLQGVDADAVSFGMAARSSLESGNVDEAVEFLRRALSIEPDNIEVVLNLAGILISAGRADEARTVLGEMPEATEKDKRRSELLELLIDVREGNVERALISANKQLSERPDDISLLKFIGEIHISTGNFEEARELFARAQSLAPEDVSPYLSLARIEIAEGDLVSARVQYETVLEMDADEVRAMVALARVASMEGKRDESVELLIRARRADARAIAPRIILGRIYLAQREFEAVEDVVGEALGVNDTIAELHYIYGQAKRAQGAHSESLRSYQRSVDLEPANPAYRLGLARAHISTDNRARAKSLLEESYEQFPTHVDTGVLWSALIAKMGDSDRALAIARELQEKVPDSAVPNVLEGELLAGRKQYQDAVTAYDQALEKDNNRDHAYRAFQLRGMAGAEDATAPLLGYLASRPADIGVRKVLAQAYYESENRLDEAKREYEAVVGASPEDHVALNNLAVIYNDIGDSRAEDLARRAYEIAPDSANIADTLASVLVKQGNLDEGIEFQRVAVALAGGQPGYRYRLASALVDAGYREEARSILAEVLAQDVEFEGRKEAEQLLEKL